MICLRCDNKEFVPEQDAVIEQELRGELFHVHTPVVKCSKCGWVTVDAATGEELRRRTADAYRKKHRLLTSDEIRSLRQLLDMSQKEFAAFARVGEASVKRWETWLVQEKSSDELIRLKCEKELYQRLAQKPASALWISGHHHGTIEAANGVTIEKPASPPVPKPSRWDLDTALPEPADEESQMSLCNANEPSICGLSPPRFDEVEFSLSAPFLARSTGRALKKKMPTNLIA